MDAEDGLELPLLAVESIELDLAIVFGVVLEKPL